MRGKSFVYQTGVSARKLYTNSYPGASREAVLLLVVCYNTCPSYISTCPFFVSLSVPSRPRLLPASDCARTGRISDVDQLLTVRSPLSLASSYVMGTSRVRVCTKYFRRMLQRNSARGAKLLPLNAWGMGDGVRGVNCRPSEFVQVIN